jgi:small neutral amino acid transporter SnatA (MarC family)
LIKAVLEIIGAVILIVFGLLFLLFLPTTISEISTDAIFIGAGILFIRKALQDRNKEKIQEHMNQKRPKNPNAKTDKKKIR